MKDNYEQAGKERERMRKQYICSPIFAHFRLLGLFYVLQQSISNTIKLYDDETQEKIKE